MNNRFLSMLGISRKAGLASLGFDKAKDCIFKGTAKVVVVCSDISEKTLKELEFHARKAGVQIIQSRYSMFDISNAVGSKTGIVAVTDSGIAKKLCALWSEDRQAADGTVRKD